MGCAPFEAEPGFSDIEVHTLARAFAAREWDLGKKIFVMRAVALNWSGRGARVDIDDDQLTNYKSFLTKKEGYLRGVTPTGAKRKPKRL